MAISKIRLTGGCQCGAVRYTVSEMPVGTVCHCRMCQKAVCGAFAALAAVDVAALSWTRGEPSYFESSSIASRGFCRLCETPLTYQGLDRSKIDITTGSFDTLPPSSSKASMVARAASAGWRPCIAFPPTKRRRNIPGSLINNIRITISRKQGFRR